MIIPGNDQTHHVKVGEQVGCSVNSQLGVFNPPKGWNCCSVLGTQLSLVLDIKSSVNCFSSVSAVLVLEGFFAIKGFHPFVS